MWFKWAVIALFALNVIMTTAKIGDPRKPISRSDAVGSLMFGALMIAGVVYYWR